MLNRKQKILLKAMFIFLIIFLIARVPNIVFADTNIITPGADQYMELKLVRDNGYKWKR